MVTQIQSHAVLLRHLPFSGPASSTFLKEERQDLISEGFHLGDRSLSDRVLWSEADGSGVRSLRVRFGGVAGDHDAQLSCLATVKTQQFRLTAAGNYDMLKGTFKSHNMLEHARATGFMCIPDGHLSYDDWLQALIAMRSLEDPAEAESGYSTVSAIHGATLKVGHNLFEVGEDRPFLQVL